MASMINQPDSTCSAMYASTNREPMVRARVTLPKGDRGL